jgi:phosphonate transport system permease protein
MSLPPSDTLPLWQDRPFQERKRSQLHGRVRQVIIVAVLLILVVLASRVCGVDLKSFTEGISKGLSLLQLFFPPQWSAFPDMVQPIAVTIVMALAATIIGTLLSVPCALAASSNIAPKWLRYGVRLFIGLERGVPEIILLLFMVAAFGLGAFPGLIALSISSIGMLAKLLADSTEEIEPQLLESISATGATHSQVIRYAIIPQILPSLFANALFRFEVNVRASVLLGAVGAGGIGYELDLAISSLEYRRASVAILSSLFLVLLSERLSDFLRSRFLGGGQLL